MGRIARRHQAKRRRWREAGVAERKLDTSFWLASGGDLEDDASWAGDDRGASDDDDAVDAFLLGANPDGAPDPDDDSGGSEDDADSWAGDGRDGGSDDDMWGVCEDDDGDAASASDPDSDSSDDAWAREWARRLSTDETSPRNAATDAGAEEARLAREMLGDDVVMADSSGDDSDSSDEDSDDGESSDESSDSNAAPAAYREPLVTTWDKKRKRKSGGYSPRGGIVRARRLEGGAAAPAPRGQVRGGRGEGAAADSQADVRAPGRADYLQQRGGDGQVPPAREEALEKAE